MRFPPNIDPFTYPVDLSLKILMFTLVEIHGL